METELWKEAIGCPESVLAPVQGLSAGVPGPMVAVTGASDTLDSPQLMEPIVLNLFFFFFSICVGGEGKGFTFVFCFSG